MNDLISRQAAINAVKCGALSAAMVYGRTDAGRTALIETVKAIKALPSARPEQRWIPCSEMLPKNVKKHYWVCTDTGYQCECRWTNVNHLWTELTTEWHWHFMDIPQYSDVIAWMPLPEPYAERRTDGHEREN